MKDKTLQRLELEMAVHNFVENLDLIIENGKALAKIRKAKYDALIAEGFTEQQALHIVSVSKPLE